MDYRRTLKNTGTANRRSRLDRAGVLARVIVLLRPENQQTDTPLVPGRQFPKGWVMMKDAAKSHLPVADQMFWFAHVRWKLYSYAIQPTSTVYRQMFL
jgi:hypothetical protein